MRLSAPNHNTFGGLGDSFMTMHAGGSERMRLTASGEVLLGQTAPVIADRASRLHVEGARAALMGTDGHLRALIGTHGI